jgi:hypothetical protein
MLPITDIYRWLDGSEFMGERLVVQFARGSTRPRDGPGFGQERMAPRPRRTVHRMTITGLPFETSWQVRILSSIALRARLSSQRWALWFPLHLLTQRPGSERLRPPIWSGRCLQ